MPKGGYWMLRTMRSGKVIEKSQFYVGERKPRAPKQKGNSSAAKKDQNMNLAVRCLARIINCNWGRGDLWLTFKYDEEHFAALGNDSACADRTMSLAWRRLRRELSDLGVKLRGFWITADKDPETGKAVRLHHHAVIGAEGVTVRWSASGELEEFSIGGRSVSDIWGQGSVNVEPLRQQGDYTPIALYCIRQAVGGKDAKKWHTTRGLEKPVIESERILATHRELRAPGGAVVSEVGHYDAESGTHYIRYVRKPRPPKVGGRKEAAIWREDSEKGDEGRYT